MTYLPPRRWVNVVVDELLVFGFVVGAVPVLLGEMRLLIVVGCCDEPGDGVPRCLNGVDFFIVDIALVR